MKFSVTLILPLHVSSMVVWVSALLSMVAVSSSVHLMCILILVVVIPSLYKILLLIGALSITDIISPLFSE